jgi:predicted Na+-dependent transporter
MMPPISGNLKIKSILIVLSLLCVFALPAWACPACAVSGPQRTFWQTFLALSAMGILPIVLGVVITLMIVRIQKDEQKKISHS